MAEGHRIQDKQGHTIADIWLRKGVPGSEKPDGPKEAVQFPFLADGELVGVLQFATEGHDYRDQPIAKGVYTMRYGLAAGKWRSSGREYLSRLFAASACIEGSDRSLFLAANSSRSAAPNRPAPAIPPSFCCSRRRVNHPSRPVR